MIGIDHPKPPQEKCDLSRLGLISEPLGMGSFGVVWAAQCLANSKAIPGSPGMVPNWDTVGVETLEKIHRLQRV